MNTPTIEELAAKAGHARKISRTLVYLGYMPVDEKTEEAIRIEYHRQRRVASDRQDARFVGGIDPLRRNKMVRRRDEISEKRILENQRNEKAAQEVERAKYAETVCLPWLALPCASARVKRAVEKEVGYYASKISTRRDLLSSLAILQVEVMRHWLVTKKKQRWSRCHRSAESLYVTQKTGRKLRLRLSNHELGYSDYGTRKQSHRGPEAIFAGGESFEDCISIIAEAICEYRN